MANPTSEIQLLAPSALIQLFVLDTTSLAGGSLDYFHAGTNELTLPVVWQGQTYTPLPIEVEGFDVIAKGALPRPKVRLANVGGLFSAEVRERQDLVSCKVIRKRTFKRYLDAVNFVGGVNATADPTMYFPDEVWFVEKKVSENQHMIEWELSSAFDLMGVMLPNREVIQNTCVWRYKSAECGYAGTSYFDRNDVACGIADDSCGHRLASCRLRFGVGALPFGGFPGAQRYEAR